ncbi:MAG: hypothetical protein K2X77_13440 [Candidatus Obscuribacterales bacterium]|jgi:hypothetical protein|nr:hypothetical protein [Candidatus Obscuribacterales bacterium]
MQYEDQFDSDYDPDWCMIEIDSSVATHSVNAFSLSLGELEQIAKDFENPFSGYNDRFRREHNRHHYYLVLEIIADLRVMADLQEELE